jgi:hypothetical protein
MQLESKSDKTLVRDVEAVCVPLLDTVTSVIRRCKYSGQWSFGKGRVCLTLLYNVQDFHYVTLHRHGWSRPAGFYKRGNDFLL